jgi:hypothetical protein
MSDINPNINMTETQTATNGKIELDSAAGAVSFDELEQVIKDSKKAKAAEKKAEKSIDLTSDDKKGDKVKEDKTTETKEKSEPKEAKTNAEQNKENIEKARKLIKAKFQDKEYELDEESVVPVKIDGKEVEVPVKDLMSNYSGKVAYDKRFTELSKRDKEIKSMEFRAKQAADNLKSVFEEKDQTVRMFRMAQMAGVDPVQFRNNFLNDNINLLEKWYGMSEDERKADALAYEAQYHKHRADTLESTTKEQQAQRELQQKVESLRASHQIAEDEFTSYQDQVEQAVNNGQLDKSFLAPEKIIETIKKDKLWTATDAALQGLELSWSEQDRGNKILKMVEDAFQMGFKPEDMSEIVSEIYGDKKAQKKVQQIKQEREQFMTGKKDVIQQTAKKDSPVFFDEII